MTHYGWVVRNTQGSAVDVVDFDHRVHSSTVEKTAEATQNPAGRDNKRATFLRTWLSGLTFQDLVLRGSITLVASSRRESPATNWDRSEKSVFVVNDDLLPSGPHGDSILTEVVANPVSVSRNSDSLGITRGNANLDIDAGLATGVSAAGVRNLNDGWNRSGSNVTNGAIADVLVDLGTRAGNHETRFAQWWRLDTVRNGARNDIRSRVGAGGIGIGSVRNVCGWSRLIEFRIWDRSQRLGHGN